MCCVRTSASRAADPIAVIPLLSLSLRPGDLVNEVELNVLGMNCGSSVASVTRSLQDVPGIVSVSVDLFGGTARVRTRTGMGS